MFAVAQYGHRGSLLMVRCGGLVDTSSAARPFTSAATRWGRLRLPKEVSEVEESCMSDTPTPCAEI